MRHGLVAQQTLTTTVASLTKGRYTRTRICCDALRPCRAKSSGAPPEPAEELGAAELLAELEGVLELFRGGGVLEMCPGGLRAPSSFCIGACTL